MARRCAISGKRPQYGHNVSHANNKTHRRFLPNLQRTSLFSDALGRMVALRVSVNGLRTIEHSGGLDAFLLDARSSTMSLELRRLRRQVERARARTATASPA